MPATGKTHLLRRLEPELERLNAVVQYDASAAMDNTKIAPSLGDNLLDTPGLGARSKCSLKSGRVSASYPGNDRAKQLRIRGVHVTSKKRKETTDAGSARTPRRYDSRRTDA